LTDEGYSRNVLYALNMISTFFLYNYIDHFLSGNDWQWRRLVSSTFS